MQKKIISEKSKTVERSQSRLKKDDIYISMEHQLESDTYHYKIECHGCSRACDLGFYYPKKLSFAFVGKIAVGLCSPCKKLAAVEVAAKKDHVGQLPLTSIANNKEA